MNAPLKPRKRFGQHFLSDPAVIERIVAEIGPASGDTIVEIGPGRGAITDPLARRDVELHAIELDRDLAARLRARFADRPNVHLHQADALRFDYSTLGDALRVVGNLPYNISTPLLFRLIEFRQGIRDMHFMLQKEVVDRMAASPGSRRFGRLTVMLGCYVDVEPLFDVEPCCFEPPPKVVSSVVRLLPKAAAEIDVHDESMLRSVVAQAFSQRRKTLRNALKGRIDDVQLEAAGIDPQMRAEQVPINTWVRLSNQLARGP